MAGELGTSFRRFFAQRVPRWTSTLEPSESTSVPDNRDIRVSAALPLSIKRTKSKEANVPDTGVSGPVSLTESECDDYVSFFLDWAIDRGHIGRFDRDQVEALTREFDSYANTSGIQSNPLFRALGRRGIKSKLVDLDKSDTRYLERKASGIVRPRIRVYLLPTDVPDLQGEHTSDINEAA